MAGTISTQTFGDFVVSATVYALSDRRRPRDRTTREEAPAVLPDHLVSAWFALAAADDEMASTLVAEFSAEDARSIAAAMVDLARRFPDGLRLRPPRPEPLDDDDEDDGDAA